jgi:hypothetical protein
LPLSGGMTRTFRPSTHVRASFSEDGLVLLDVDRGVVLAANAVGARIWQLIELRHTSTDIADRIASDYGVPAPRAAADVSAFIASLLARELVVEEPRS